MRCNQSKYSVALLVEFFIDYLQLLPFLQKMLSSTRVETSDSGVLEPGT